VEFEIILFTSFSQIPSSQKTYGGYSGNTKSIRTSAFSRTNGSIKTSKRRRDDLLPTGLSSWKS
jgi:hypothetical protein